LRTSILKYTFFVGLTIFFIACSTKKNSFLSRNSHALSTKYNILYNGGIALDAGVAELKTTYSDNFWERLPIERMQPKQDAMAPGETRNANFGRAEEKATKAIQKHSMNIGGGEKNPQMDEAHLMLGKARYYDQRYVPALEAFNYILYKYPGSDKIYEAKVWREKTNVRMENDQLAVNNLRKLLDEIKFKDQIFADANAIIAQAFLNLEQKDSAVARLKRAEEFTTHDEEKARYRFILGQLYEELGFKDSAYASYQQVIDMKRKSPRQYVIHAHSRQAQQFDFKDGDTLQFVEKYEKLLKDRENRPYLGMLNHQMALFYDKQKNYDQAQKYYNLSLKNKSQDAYLTASNYRNLADIYFNRAKYVSAGQYYDSTLVQLNPRTREHKLIKKKRENLVDVIKYEGIAQANDSILNVLAMGENARVTYYENYIAKLKVDDEAKRLKEEADAQQAAESGVTADDKDNDVMVKGGPETGRGVSGGARRTPSVAQPTAGTAPGTGNVAAAGRESDFYFYNPTTVAFGKSEFRKSWGDRSLTANWRVSALQANTAGGKTTDDQGDTDAIAGGKEPTADERYSVDFYLSRLPGTQEEIATLVKDRNFAYYQLGVIYKEKFREYKLAAEKLEKLLAANPEERLVLPSMYNLYKIYEIIDTSKAQAMKDRIISQYPDSRYAQILGNTNSESIASLSPEIAYNNLFKQFEEGDYRTVLTNTETAIDQFTGDEIVSKFELLKAHTVGKLRGLEEYRKALNFVALNYPNSPEGKDAEALLGKEIPALENLKFSSSETSNWKILYTANDPNDKKVKFLQDKVKKFLTERQLGKMRSSFDIYTENENFVVIHGMPSEEYAKGIASILKEVKEYKVPDTPIIISGQNYEIVQMKKNLPEYLANPEFVPASVTEQLPFTPTSAQAQTSTKVAVSQVRAALKNASQPAAPVATPAAQAAQAIKEGKTPQGQNQAPGKGQGQNQVPPRAGNPSMQPPGQLGAPPSAPQQPKK
jgi:tetratricopeptide (TPR) repeat protein